MSSQTRKNRSTVSATSAPAPLLGLVGDAAHYAAQREAGRAHGILDLLDATLTPHVNSDLLTRFQDDNHNAEKVDPHQSSDLATALAVAHQLMPERGFDEPLLHMLDWTHRQDRLRWRSPLGIGQFLRGIVLALDSVGQSWPRERCADFIQHLARRCIEADPPELAPAPNAGFDALLPMLELPGTGFHVHAHQVNNWDVVCSQGLLYVAHALSSLCPEQRETATQWRKIAEHRLRRFCQYMFSPEGAYGEGPGYYSYGLTAAIAMLDSLQWTSTAPTDAPLPLGGLLASPHWLRMIHPGTVADGVPNLNDCEMGKRESPAVPFWIARQAQSPNRQDLAETLLQRIVDERPQRMQPVWLAWSALWRDGTLTRRPFTGSACQTYSQVGATVCRTGFERDDIWLYGRSGDFAGVHTHADRGAIRLAAFGEHLITEMGASRHGEVRFTSKVHPAADAHSTFAPTEREQLRYRDGAPTAGATTNFVRSGNDARWTMRCDEVFDIPTLARRQVHWLGEGVFALLDIVAAEHGVHCWFHTDNRDRQGRIEWRNDMVEIRRPKAGAWLVPLQPVRACLLGTGPQDDDPEGVTSVRIEHDDCWLPMLCLPYRPNERTEPVTTRVAASTWETAFADATYQCIVDFTSPTQPQLDLNRLR
ncbi:MAG: hypothetical protein ACOC9P_01025 [bacterium]